MFNCQGFSLIFLMSSYCRLFIVLLECPYFIFIYQNEVYFSDKKNTKQRVSAWYLIVEICVLLFFCSKSSKNFLF